MAATLRIPAVMLGQGFGPLTDATLRRLAAQVLPSVELIAVREGLFSPELLRELGVASHRIVVTGDDAIEMAYRERPADTGRGIGINLRVRDYGATDDDVRMVGSTLRDAGTRYAARLIPVPITTGGPHSDIKSIRDLLGGAYDESDGGAALGMPAETIRALHHCRVVVTGAYHAAVFALSQGIPAVCLTRSDYYDTKFHGLAHQFGDGCYIVSLRADDARRRIDAAIARAWSAADQVRPALLQSAVDQIASSRPAYERVQKLLSQPNMPTRPLNSEDY